MSLFAASAEPSEVSAAVKAQFARQRHEARERLRRGDAPSHIAYGIAEAASEVAIALFERARARYRLRGASSLPPVALLALGGLGRRELALYSDLDLVLLSPEPDHPAVAEVAQATLYPLWDARVDVGHAVRRPEDFDELARRDDAVRTTAIDWRPLAGDEAVLEDLRRRLGATLRSQNTRQFVRRSIAAWEQASRDDTVYRLEPDIKHGPGGVRQLQRVWWMARLVWRIDVWDDLLTRGLVSNAGFGALMAVREQLTGVRLALHSVAGRRQEQLRFEYQDEVAEILGFHPMEKREAALLMLQAYYGHAKMLRAVARDTLDRCREACDPPRRWEVREVEGFHVFRGQLTCSSAQQFEKEPTDILRLFRVAQCQELPMYVHARARVAEDAPRLLTETTLGTETAQRLMLELLSDPRDAGAMLGMMHELGVLERAIPELQAVAGLVQRDTYHTLTVDAHLVACARRTLRLLGGDFQDVPPEVAEVVNRISRPHVLVLSALLHDIGKGYGYGHAERGARMAEGIVCRLGWPADDLRDIQFLVREHLTMFKISQRRDLEDPELIGRFARDVETSERLDLLFVLSFADATTTGPAAWSDWKRSLLHALFKRTRKALREGAAQQSLASRAAERLQALQGENDAALCDFAARLPPRHLVAYDAIILRRHYAAVKLAEREGAVCLLFREAAHGGAEILVVAPDRTGLLADAAEVFAAGGVSIDAASVSGTTDGWAIDTFVVSSDAVRKLGDAALCEGLLKELRAVAEGTLNVGERLRERQRAGRILKNRTPRPEKRIVFDLGATTEATVVDVFSLDRVGLLHDIARAINAAEASITLARISTEGERAIDSFYVVETQGRGALSTEHRAALEAAILEVL